MSFTFAIGVTNHVLNSPKSLSVTQGT